MLDSVKDVLTKEVDVKGILTQEVDVKGILTKEVNVKEFLEMEIELTKLKELLATEIKLKEFLFQEIDLGKLLSKTEATDEIAEVKAGAQTQALEQPSSDEEQTLSKPQIEIKPDVKRDLPAYDYSLIETLHGEHKRIRFIFNRIMSYAIEKNYKKVSVELEAFNKEIRTHYKKADIDLYAYLKTYVQIKYPRREKAFTQLSLEMKNLSIEIKARTYH